MTEQPIRNKYFELLQAHVARPAEEHLAAITELGRALVLADVPPEDIGEIHEQAILRLTQESPHLTLLEAALSTSAALTELLMPYGLAFRARNAQLQREIAEHERVEETLRESEKRYRTLIENQGEGIGFVDTEENFTFANPAAHVIFGVPPGGLIGRKLREFVDAETFALIQAQTEMRQVGEKSVYEIEFDRPDGERCNLLVTATPRFDNEGQFIGTFGVFRDITERKQVEDALRKSEEKYRTILETIEDGYFEVDIAGNFTFFNDSLCKLLGYPEDELMGMNNRQYMDDVNAKALYQTFNTVYRTGKPARAFDWEVIRKDGARRFVEASVSLLRDSTGEPAGFRGIVRDVTERKRAEREIEERRVYLEGVLGAAPDAIATLDAHHRIVEWNAGAERLFGYSREEVIGQNIDDRVTNPDVFEEAVGFTQTVTSGKEIPPTETVRYRKDGSPVNVLLAGSPIMVGDDLIGTVVVYTDITARVRMEETLRALALIDDLTGLYNRRGFLTLGQQQLKAANRAKRRMVLLFSDFNGLKRINDTLGHLEGDRALIQTADVLRETFRESDIIARIGGDEFVVLAIETNGAPAEVLTARFQENLAARNAREGRRYELSLSVGLARYDPEHPCSIDELLAQADRAMYEQKQDNQKYLVTHEKPCES